MQLSLKGNIYCCCNNYGKQLRNCRAAVWIKLSCCLSIFSTWKVVCFVCIIFFFISFSQENNLELSQKIWKVWQNCRCIVLKWNIQTNWIRFWQIHLYWFTWKSASGFYGCLTGILPFTDIGCSLLSWIDFLNLLCLQK